MPTITGTMHMGDPIPFIDARKLENSPNLFTLAIEYNSLLSLAHNYDILISDDPDWGIIFTFDVKGGRCRIR